MFAKLASLAVAAALPFLCLQCITSHAPVIQSSLQAATVSALDGANIKGVTVGADGRDIVLKGVVDTEAIKAQAGTLAMALAGVRTVDNQLMVAPSAAVVQSRINEILLRKKIEFETNRDVILPVSTPVLEEALAVLKQAPQITVTINGHTDSQGNAAANKDLSARRALAVSKWFQSQGIDANRLKSAGYGAEKPIDTNDTEAGRAKNRRVEIIANSAAAIGGK
jgi:outer membrane protein OmpA-like peptidoglycan-associated protein